MTDELKPVRCGCGGEAVIYVTHWWGKCYVCECEKCGTASRPCITESEAIEAWNRAMGGNVRDCAKDARCSERTAKVVDTWKVGGYDELNAWCPECEHRITRGCSYCPTCGVKLDWSGNE